MKKSIALLTGLLVTGSALADIAPPRPAGKVFVEHRVRVENLAEHDKWSVLVYDTPTNGNIRAHLVFSKGTDAEQTMTRGRSWRSTSRFSRPQVWLVPTDSLETWNKETMALVEKQRQACAERGEGCAHISRFQPSYPPPKDAVTCNASIDVVKAQPTKLGKRVVDVFKLERAGANDCKVTHKREGAGEAGLVPPISGGPSRWLFVGGLMALLASMGLVSRLKRSVPHPVAS